jgi:Rod binding domain-containing protein
MLDAIHEPPPTLVKAAPAGTRSHDTFTQALSQHTSRIAAANALDTGQSRAEQLREAAGQLVSTAFLLPLMKQARSSVFKTDLFGGGFDQDAMQEKLDVHFADAVANSDRFPLTDALVKHLDRNA